MRFCFGVSYLIGPVSVYLELFYEVREQVCLMDSMCSSCNFATVVIELWYGASSYWKSTLCCVLDPLCLFKVVDGYYPMRSPKTGAITFTADFWGKNILIFSLLYENKSSVSKIIATSPCNPSILWNGVLFLISVKSWVKNISLSLCVMSAIKVLLGIKIKLSASTSLEVLAQILVTKIVRISRRTRSLCDVIW